MIDRHVERFRGLEIGAVLRLVEIFALGMRIDHRALHAELAYRPFQLLAGAAGIVGRDRGKRGIAARMATHRIGELIVAFARERRRRRRIEHLHARCAEEDDLHGDAARVHVAQALIVQILDPAHERGRARLRAEKESPEAMEARIPSDRLLSEQAPVTLQHLFRRPSFFSGYSNHANSGQGRNHSAGGRLTIIAALTPNYCGSILASLT